MRHEIQIKRVYDPFDAQDGYRILVDRVWPRGMTKEGVHADLWLKEAAPSSELRKWYCHDPLKWDEFKKLYIQELDENPLIVDKLLAFAAERRLTLLYASREQELNQAVVLRDYLLSRSKGSTG